jgi:hypothetical protein
MLDSRFDFYSVHTRTSEDAGIIGSSLKTSSPLPCKTCASGANERWKVCQNSKCMVVYE